MSKLDRLVIVGVPESFDMQPIETITSDFLEQMHFQSSILLVRFLETLIKSLRSSIKTGKHAETVDAYLSPIEKYLNGMDICNKTAQIELAIKHLEALITSKRIIRIEPNSISEGWGYDNRGELRDVL